MANKAITIMAGISGFFLLTGLALAAISITSPKDGTGVTPGTTVTVQVASDNGQPVVLLTNYHFTVTPMQIAQPPYVFAVSIPANATAGSYAIGAENLGGTSVAGSIPPVAHIHIQVNPTVATGATLVVLPAQVYFDYAGQTMSVEILLSQNGVTSGVGSATSLKAESADPTKITVNPENPTSLIAEHSGGTTVVTYSLGTASGTLAVINRSTGIRGDLAGHGFVDLDDLEIIQAALNTPAVRDPVTGKDIDARDLNGDGLINIEDARILTTLCTYSRCALHP